MIELTIPGRPIVKKNTQRVVGYGKSKHVIYSPQFTAWWKSGLLVVKRQSALIPVIETPVEVWYQFYFKNRQGEADVSNLIEGPQDLLVKTAVLKDDRLIFVLHAEKHFGSDEPRTVIKIKQLGEIGNETKEV